MEPYSDAFYVILGSLISVVIASATKWSFNKRDRHNESVRLVRKANNNKKTLSKYGTNWDDYFNTNEHKFPELKKVFFWNEMSTNAVRPLLVLSIINLFTYDNKLGIFFLIILIILFLIHEVFLGTSLAGNGFYRFFLLLLWISFYIIQVDKCFESINNVGR